jgi:hypothetical protein
MERYEDAADLFATTIASARRSLPEGHWYLGAFLAQYGLCLTSLERFGEAEAALIEAHQLLSKALGADHGRAKATRRTLVKLYETWDRPGKADQYRAPPSDETPPRRSPLDPRPALGTDAAYVTGEVVGQVIHLPYHSAGRMAGHRPAQLQAKS